jgi:hypothetical protein
LIESRGYTATPAIVEKLMKASARKIAALKSYFEDGNALNIKNLALAINTDFPVDDGSGGVKPPPDPSPSPTPSPTPDDPGSPAEVPSDPNCSPL